MTYDFVAVGDVMLDIRIAEGPGGATLHAPITVVSGGSAVNAARAARRLGARAAVVGRVGTDAAGTAVAHALRADGIDALLETGLGATGTVAYVGGGVVADRGANAGWRPDGLPDARVTLVSGYLDPEAVAAALQQAHGLRAVDLQRPGTRAVGADVVLGPRIALEELADEHRVVCSTLGARGAVAMADGNRVEVAPSHVIAGNPRGAGDAFAAGFLLALADGHPLRECVERGCRLAEDAVAERHQRDARRQ